MRNVGIFATFLFLSVLSVTYSGYALSILWDWFVVSVFNVESISIPSAIGIALIVGYLTKNDDKPKEGSSFTEQMSEATFKAFFKPTFALLIGWLVTLFM